MLDEQSYATTSPVEYETPDGLAYEDYQNACISYCMGRNDILIADPPGLGKTIEAIGVANVMAPSSILIICPANLKGNWKKEFDKWILYEYKVDIAQGNYCDCDADVVIINYDIIKRHIDNLNKRHWDLLICDESHMMKNEKAVRTKMILGGRVKGVDYYPIQASKRLFLSGTPMLSRPIELWTTIRAFDPSGMGSSYYKYIYRYCNAWKAPYGLDVTGARNLPELQKYLRNNFMIRREKKILNLPPKRRQIIELPKKGLAKLIEREKTVVESHLGNYLSQVGLDIDIADQEGLEEEVHHEGTYEEQGGSVPGMDSQIGFEDISRVRRELSIAKIPMVQDHLDRLLESEEKVLVFVHHKEVARLLAERYGKHAVTITGKTSSKQASLNVDSFQNKSECRLLIGNIMSAGKGHTLTATSTVVFAEMSWVPGDMEQAEDRAWRYGQKNNVLIYHLVVEDSLDARMVHKIIEKQKDIDKTLNHE